MQHLALSVMLALAVVACSSGDDDDDNDDNNNNNQPMPWGPPPPGSGGNGAVPEGAGGEVIVEDPVVTEPPPPERTCVSRTANAEGIAETAKAAYCFGMTYDETYMCTSNTADNLSTCTGDFQTFTVSWRANSGDVRQEGTNYDLGSIRILDVGVYELDRFDGLYGDCTFAGGTATLCYVPPGG